MIGGREVITFYGERMLAHRPDADYPFLTGRLDRRVREILNGLGVRFEPGEPQAPGISEVTEAVEFHASAFIPD